MPTDRSRADGDPIHLPGHCAEARRLSIVGSCRLQSIGEEGQLDDAWNNCFGFTLTERQSCCSTDINVRFFWSFSFPFSMPDTVFVSVSLAEGRVSRAVSLTTTAVELAGSKRSSELRLLFPV
ncbi:hypothetical protein RRG08_014782 [Elysia crispata]|uniref:Uncharacterized protein n=1 Tax=Elysia crispata TaxID=231223 RepID=A0AAE1E5F3_9GAST|nr:hypothetical protein RRG08_014782 [Elysia crispata]